MTVNIDFTSDKIKKAVKKMKEIRPVYEPLLDFYQKIFIEQEDSKSRIHVDPIHITHEILSVKTQENFPLITVSEFVIDTNASEVLLKKICNIAMEAEGNMAKASKALINAIDTEKIDPGLLFSSLLKGDESFFKEIEDTLGIEKKVLAFIIYNSIKPSLSLCAEQVSTYLDKDSFWEKGYCPICGSSPGLSVLMEEGKRLFLCSFCWHQWPSRRLYCPFCDNEDNKTLRYFYNEEEKEYRVDVCDRCKKYIKTIDMRETERILYPPLEQVSTLHLDMKAKEMGLKSGITLDLQV